MFAPPGIPTFQYPQQPAQTRSPGAKSKMDLPIHTSPSHPPTGGSAKRQAVELGQTSQVRAEHRRQAQELSVGQLPCSTFAMTPPMSTVLGYRPTEQGHCDSRHELERGKCELREDTAIFEVVEPLGSGTPILYLVNPQTDTMPLVHMRQTIKHAIDFTHSSDFWRDDTASPPRQCLTAAQ